MTRIMLLVSHLLIAGLAALAVYYWQQSSASNSNSAASNASPIYFEGFVEDFTGSNPLDSDGSVAQTANPKAGSVSIFNEQFAAHQLAASSDVEGLEAALNKHLQHPDSFYHENIAFIFLERFIELDVRAALSFVDRSNVSFDKKKQLYASIVTSWVRVDPRSAVSYFLGIRSIDLKQTIGMRLLLDQTLENTPYFDEIKDALGARGDQLLARVRQQKASPSEAFADALQIGGTSRSGMLMQAANRWYVQDPDAALEAILNITDTKLRDQTFAAILRIEAREDAFKALELLRMHLPDHASFEASVMQQLIAQDPTRGLPILEEYVARTGNLNAMSQAVSVWARNDPRAAIAYASALEPDARRMALASASMAYLQAHPQEAMDWIMSLDDQQIQHNAFNSLPHINEQLAEEWLRRSGDSERSGWLLQGLAGKKSQQGLDASLAWLDGYQDNPAFENAMSTILSRHAHSQPGDVADVLENHTDNIQMQSVFSQTASTWANSNAEDALTWIETLPAGHNRDTATSAYIMTMAHRDKDLAIEMVNSMPIDRRDQVKIGLAQQLIARSPAEADAIAKQLDLSPELAEQIKTGLTNYGGDSISGHRNLMSLPH